MVAAPASWNSGIQVQQYFAIHGNARPATHSRTLAANISSVNVTGINPWWQFEEGDIPGVGHWMLNDFWQNLIIQATDFDVPYRGIDFAFRRTYNSFSGHDYSDDDGATEIGQYGNGWTNTWDAHVSLNNCPNTGYQYSGYYGFSVYDIDGARYDYCFNSSGQLLPPPGMQGTQLIASGGSLNWYKKDGTYYNFYAPYDSRAGLAGRINRIIARNSNNAIQFVYAFVNPTTGQSDPSSSAYLTYIQATTDNSKLQSTLYFEDVNGRRLMYEATLPNPSGGYLTYLYGYDANGNLVSVGKPLANNNGGWAYEGYGGTPTQTCNKTATNPSSTPCWMWVQSPRYFATYNTSTGSASDGGYLAFNVHTNGQLDAIQWVGMMNPSASFLADGTNTALQSGFTNGQLQYNFESVSFGNPTTLTDSEGHQIVQYFDSTWHPTTRKEYTGSQWLSTTEAWDANNNLVSTTDARGNETDYAHDANGNTIAVAAPAATAGSTRPLALYSYDSFNNVTSFCDPVVNGSTRVWSTTYQTTPSDSLCPANVGERFTYSYSVVPYGELTDAYSATGYHRHLTYSPSAEGGTVDFGLPTSITGDPIVQLDGTTRTPSESLAYDANGNLIALNNGTGTSSFKYDTLGRLTSATDPDSHTSYLSYYPDGSVAAGQSASQHAASVGTTYAYDVDGNKKSETHYHGCLSTAPPCTPGVTQWWYDGADRSVEVKHPTSTSEPLWVERFLYDLTGGGNVSSDGVTFAAHGNEYATQRNNIAGGFLSENLHAYDALNRVVSAYSFQPCSFVAGTSGAVVCSRSPVATTRTYDSPGNAGLLTSTLDPLGESKTFAYDALAKPTAIQYAGDGGVTAARTFAYDLDGRATNLTMGSIAQTYQYDAMGHPTSSNEGVQSNLAYYGDGSLQSLQVPSLSGLAVNYSYRSDGRLQTKALTYPGVTNKLAYSYSTAGRYTGMADFSAQQSQTVSYDQYGRLASQAIPAGTFSNFTYDLEGNVASYTAFGGETITNQYGLRGDLLGQAYAPNLALTGGGTQWPSFGYTSSQGLLVQSSSEQWDARTGAILGFNDTGISYSYDAAARLTSASQGTSSTHLTYDAENRQITGAVANFASTNNACTGSRFPVAPSIGQYTWGPNGQVVGAVGSSLETQVSFGRSYVLGQLLYQVKTSSPSFPTVVNAIHLGQDVTIGVGGTQSQPTGQLGVNDYDFTGALTSAHNATGHAPWNVPNYYLQPCSPQVPVPPASSGYVPTQGDGITEPAPGLLYDGANYIDTNSSRIISPVTLSATTASGGAFASGVARRHAQTISICAGAAIIDTDANEGCGGVLSNPPLPKLQPGVGGDTGGTDGGGFGGFGGFGDNIGGGPSSPCAIPMSCKLIGHTHNNPTGPNTPPAASRPAPSWFPGFGTIWLYYATSTNGACYWGITCALPARTRAQARMGRTIRNAWEFPEGTVRPEAMNVETYQMSSTNTLQPGSPGYNQMTSISPNGVNGSYYDPESAANMAGEMEVEVPEFFPIP